MSGRWHLKSLAEDQPWHRRRVALTALLTLSVALAGCMVGPNYVRPPLETPGSFKSQADSHSAPPESWRLYRDPDLDQLIATATASNQTLKQAVAAVDQARALAREA